MPQRDVRSFLIDIQASIAEIESAVAGLTLADYKSRRPIRSQVEREFMIIGEALRQMLNLEPELVDRVSSAPEIIGFRNHLVHGYFLISDTTVWDIIQGHLPKLKHEILVLTNERG